MDEVDNEEFRARVAEPARLLRRVANQARALGEDHQWTPAGGSVAEGEWQEYVPHPSFSSVFAGLEVLRDYSDAVAHILGSDRIYVWAAMPLGRATLEVAARSWWLTEPDISAKTRLARGYELWRRSLGDTRNIPDFSLEDQRQLHGQLAQRLREHDVAHDAEDGLVTNVHDAHWRGARQILPDLYDDASYAARIYMWLTGLSHGDPWPISTAFHGEDAPEQGRRLIHTRISTAQVAVLTEAMVLAIVHAVDRWADIMGWSAAWEPWRRYYPMRAQEIKENLT